MSKKIKGERESRESLLSHARHWGAEQELLKIFSRYDDLLKGARTSDEQKAISMAGLIEIDQFFSSRDSKGNFTIYPDLKGKP